MADFSVDVSGLDPEEPEQPVSRAEAAPAAISRQNGFLFKSVLAFIIQKPRIINLTFQGMLCLEQ